MEDMVMGVMDMDVDIMERGKPKLRLSQDISQEDMAMEVMVMEVMEDMDMDVDTMAKGKLTL